MKQIFFSINQITHSMAILHTSCGPQQTNKEFLREMSGKFYPIDFMLILTDWSVMISDTAYHKKTPSNQFISFCFLLDAIIFISEHLPDNCMIYWCQEAIIQLYHTYSQHHTIPKLNCIPFFCVKFQSHDVKFSFFIVHVLCYQTFMLFLFSDHFIKLDAI